MKTQDEVVKEIREDPLGRVKIAITDIDGILRGKVVHRDKFLSLVEKGFGFCDVVFGWDMVDRCYDNTDFTGWHTAYPDAKARVDLATYRRVPWDDNIPFFLADFRNKKEEGLEICPRNLLKKVRKQAEQMGFAATFAAEYEFFNFRNPPNPPLTKGGEGGFEPITSGMFGYSLLRASSHRDYFNDLFNLLGQFNIPLEGLHTETGPGVYEAAILYSDLLEAADRATLFKLAVKEIAMRHGIVPSFMAKWNETLPGCGGHLHQSLWEGKKNIFFDPKEPNQMSSLMRSYLAGQLHCLPEILPLYCPTVNSYKRLVEGAWAPTSVTWGIDNRTTAVRVLPLGPDSTRIEFRVVGSDVNPYLAMAASLASGLYGIRKNLELKVPETVGNGYANKKAVPLPRNLQQANEAMRNSGLANELFGEVFVKHFCQTRDWEWRQYSAAVTDWELKRYFEII